MATINTYTVNPSSYDTTDINIKNFLSTRPPQDAYGDENSKTWCTYQGQTYIGNQDIYVKWGFDLSELPRDVIIDSVSCTAKCYFYTSTSTAWSSNSGIQLCCGTYSTANLRGSSEKLSARSTIEQITITEENSGTWTREDLDNIYLVTMGKVTSSGSSMRYEPQFRLYGATLTIKFHAEVEYEIITNTNNCNIEPAGTQSVGKGTYNYYKIYPNSGYVFSQLLDNGVDVSSSVIQRIDYPIFYSISQDAAADYGFSYTDPYYIATNNYMIVQAVARCTVELDLPIKASTVNIYVVNEGLSTADYGVISVMDGHLSDIAEIDTGAYWDCSDESKHTSTEQIVTFDDISSGIHQFDIKYVKNSKAKNDAMFKFRVEIILAAQYPADVYYEYVVQNIQQNHALQIYCKEAENYKITSNCSPGGSISTIGQSIVKNGNYFNIKIYPKVNYTISHVTLNSAIVEYQQVDDYYQYTIPIVQNDANVYVTFTSGNSKFFIKQNGSWTQVSNVYKKINGSWVEIEFSEAGDPFAKYIQKS